MLFSVTRLTKKFSSRRASKNRNRSRIICKAWNSSKILGASFKVNLGSVVIGHEETEGAPLDEQELDTRGLNCPLPVLRARKVRRGMAPDAVLRLLATDPGTVRDVGAMCEATGDQLMESSEKAGEFVFLIKKAG